MRATRSALWVMLAAVLLSVALAGISLANDVAVRYSVLESSKEGPVTKGTMRVEAQNLAPGSMRNLDLRLAQPAPNSIEKGLFQFGTVPAGEVRSVTGGFIFDADFTGPVFWRVDYDDANGVHHQVTVPGGAQ